jgi:hypothetical protein
MLKASTTAPTRPPASEAAKPAPKARPHGMAVDDGGGGTDMAGHPEQRRLNLQVPTNFSCNCPGCLP